MVVVVVVKVCENMLDVVSAQTEKGSQNARIFIFQINLMLNFNGCLC